ncbi:MAG TPA: hypothetical protein VL287_08935 [Gemmatimonadales bacterium]|jgi:hypothetical protein|nr:hypothetical protein [Gemmatimonadales bacterium]
MLRLLLMLFLAGCLTASAQAQSTAGDDLFGTWKFDIKQGDKKTGPRTVIVRPDSSASYGKETVRWRVKPDSLLLALGGEWVSYRLKLKGKSMVLSGGDLTEPITFDKIGPPTPRPDSVPVPPDPEQQPS